MRLKIAAKVDRVDQTYWEQRIRPMVEAHPNVEFMGELDESEKAALLGGAAALLFPVDWPERFGLAVIEAMASGTAGDRLSAGLRSRGRERWNIGIHRQHG
jgi:glycosyltransferase involved in cell wall biosynthesis